MTLITSIVTIALFLVFIFVIEYERRRQAARMFDILTVINNTADRIYKTLHSHDTVYNLLNEMNKKLESNPSAFKNIKL